MTKSQLRIFPDRTTLFRYAAQALAAAIESMVGPAPRIAFVLAGGETPRNVYEILADSPYRERLDWLRIHFFWGDERCVPPDSLDSNYAMAQEALLSRVPVPGKNIHRIRGEMPSPEKAALLYEEEIRRFDSARDVPVLDLVLLGLGQDGHTASLFPGTTWDEGRLVVANEASKPPTSRISMTPLLLNSARNIFFLVSGESKASALAAVLQGDSGDYPAKRIRPSGGSLTWLVDGAAASRLPPAEANTH